ncbi:protein MICRORCHIDIA 2 [Ziziphus jujuba]|uniref:Protein MICRORCHIDIA 2 n=1 Tax=Ziziphus jujuba TaxID=326968 RepID=A0A6P4A8A4_ZIZJJ|nr:protein MICRORCHIDIA 2 [Ziziphus jujuba]XP_015889909.2 protein MICRORCHIDIA 2 [Ziziphus jujuba]
MPPKTVKKPIDVVDIESSDEENDAGTTASKGNRKASSNKAPTPTKPSKPQPQQQTSKPTTPPVVTDNQTLLFRSFWKAGAVDIGPAFKSVVAAEDNLEHARVHPKFLHSNATSHKWAFGAIAELLDNAVDEIHNGATFVKVDKIGVMKDNSPALVFQDDGGGMDPEGIRKCMSLGYSSKKTDTTIGQYGNGFKTSTMRLGADVIVFSRATRTSQATQSVGLLSYTFLRKTGQDDVIVPMIDFDISGNWAEPIIYSSEDDWSTNLKIILEWSPFASKEELMLQFEDIGAHGTKVIVYNLWLNDEGIYELSFDDDEEDIRLRDEASHATESNKRLSELRSHISYRLCYSLRAYVSMLYLRKFTNFNIILRGKPVEQYDITDELIHSEVVLYKPQLATTSKQVAAETTIGFIKGAPALSVSGFNVYHKNRLIRPFWKVTPDGSNRGNGVIGVLEANFINPAHDKQDFERSSLFVRLETKLKQMVMEYWKGHCNLVGYRVFGSKAPNIQKNPPVVPPVGLASNMGKQLPADQHITGSSVSDLGNMHLGETIVSLPANVEQDLRKEQSGSSTRSTFQKNLPAGSYEVVTPVDSAERVSVDQICEENIQLFMRCEEYVQRQSELKQKITGLEKELNEGKKRCARLAAYLESRRKQKIMKQSSEKI